MAPHNKTTLLPFGSHYDVLRPAPSSGRRALYNYDGIRRCVKCFCLHSTAENHQTTCRGRLRIRRHGLPCLQGCGLLFEARAKASQHSANCPGEPLTFDRYGTYVCPRCHVAGLGPSAVTRHVRNCNGLRRKTLDSYRRKHRVSECDGCGDSFLRNALKTHTCGVVGDPIWMGKQAGPPDLTISAVRWFREHGLNLGGVPGNMPAVVPDHTLSLALAQDGGQPELLVLEGEEIEVGSESGGSEAGEDDESDTGEQGELDEQDPDDGTPAAARLRAAGITFGRFEQTLCEGVSWRHGYFTCPTRTVISLETANVTRGPRQEVRLSASCRACAALRWQIRKWLCESKFTTEGVHLCRRRGCHRPISALWHCRYHAEQITRINHRAEQRRGASRTISAVQMAAFLDRVPARLLQAPRWVAVKRAIDGEASGMPVFFVDTESVYDHLSRRFLVCELAVYAGSGQQLLYNRIDHGLTYTELKDRVKPAFWSKLDTIYDFTTPDTRTSGLPPAEVRQALEGIGISPASVLVEWSMGGFDLQALRATIGPEIFPQSSLFGHQPWRELGLVGSVALRPLFAAVFPESPLTTHHHRANIDTEKLYHMTRTVLSRFVLPDTQG